MSLRSKPILTVRAIPLLKDRVSVNPPSASPRASGPTSPARSPRPGAGRSRFVAQVDRDGVITRRAAVARGTVDMVLALPGVAPAGARCCCTTTRAAGSIPSRARPRRRGAAARRRRRLRHHRQRRHASCTSWSRCRATARSMPASIRSTWSTTLGERRRRSRRSWASTRIGGASATWPPTSPTRYNDGGVLSCWRRAPASGSRSPTWCRRWPGPGPTASARS